MVWPSGGVITRAMHLAGPPFTTDAQGALRFMQAFRQAVSDGSRFVLGMVRANHHAQQAAQRPVAQVQPGVGEPPMTTEENLLLFQNTMLESYPQMSEADKLHMVQGITREDLHGWELLSREEKDILRAIFLPPVSVEVPGDEPLPSDESARKVVAAMRNGTLGAHTLAPPEPPKPAAPATPAQQDSPPGNGGAAAAPPPPGVKTTEGAPQASPVVSQVPAGNNGTDTPQVPAQVAVTQETTS